MMKNKIVRWIKLQVRQARSKGVVLGLSGGVDSSIVAALAKRALGRKRVLCLILPIHSHPQDLRDARLVAKKFGLRTEQIDLSGIYDRLIRILPAAVPLARANLKPRLRMLVLYYFANRFNYLVCGTGNRSELMAGYFTKYGDGAADILPLGRLLKKQVRSLAENLGIPVHIITKPPSAGLWLGQTDEAEMGITYPELDSILERLAQKRKQVAEKAKVDKVKAMIERSRHKRQAPMVCPV